MYLLSVVSIPYVSQKLELTVLENVETDLAWTSVSVRSAWLSQTRYHGSSVFTQADDHTLLRRGHIPDSLMCMIGGDQYKAWDNPMLKRCSEAVTWFLD